MNNSNGMFESSKQQGLCPSEESLIKFHHGVLSQEEATVIERHTKTCATCKIALISLAEFRPEPRKPPATHPSQNQEEKDALVTERLRSALKVQPSAPAPQEERTVPKTQDLVAPSSFKSALAYIIILILLYPAYLGLFGRTTAAVETPIQSVVAETPMVKTYGTAQIFTLPEAQRASLEQEPTQETEFTFLNTTPLFTLAFFVPVQDQQMFQYNAKIVDENLEVVDEQLDIQSSDGLSNFLLVCNGQAFAYAEEARFTLVVSEINRATQDVSEEFNFPFKLKIAVP